MEKNKSKICYKCGKPGHISRYCKVENVQWKWERDDGRYFQYPKHVSQQIEKLKKINSQYKGTIDTIQREYEQEKTDREEFSEQCDNYIEELDEKDTIIKGLTQNIGQMQEKIDLLELKISDKLKEYQYDKRYYRIRLTQLSMVVAGVGAYFFSPILQYLF